MGNSDPKKLETASIRIRLEPLCRSTHAPDCENALGVTGPTWFLGVMFVRQRADDSTKFYDAHD